MPVEDIKAAIAGANNAQITKVKKADDELARLFTITFKESSSAPFPLNLIAPTREVYVQVRTRGHSRSLAHPRLTRVVGDASI